MSTTETPIRRALFEDDSYFLSAMNPAATTDQRDLEATALEILDSRAMADALDVATMRFELLAGSGVPDEAREGMARRMREWGYRYATLAANSDPHHPAILGNVIGHPHSWFGMDVPGTRGPGTGENADCLYRAVPIDPTARYELLGKLGEPPVGDCPFYLCANLGLSQNVAGLDWRDLQVDDDGTFVVTVDPEPAHGRPNHLQSAIDARYLYLRDCRQDWAQVPNAYRIRRLDPPGRAPLTTAEKTALATRFVVEEVPVMWWFRTMIAPSEPNTITGPANSGPVGGMTTQALLRGRVELGPDEAYVLTLSSGGAGYWSLASYDWWAMSGNVGERLTSLTNAQSRPDPGDTYTYVFAASDPGVHNWIDTESRRHTTFMNRWQQLSTDPTTPGPTAEGRLVTLAELDAVLPPGTPRVTASERAAQLAERAELFGRRFAV